MYSKFVLPNRVEQYLYYMDGTIFLLQYCGITQNTIFALQPLLKSEILFVFGYSTNYTSLMLI